MQEKNYSTETILSHLKIEALNKMQLAAIDAINNNENVILLSATGSGKTLAFLLPLLELLNAENKNTQAMIIVPSRELALQIEQVFRSMITGHKITCCYGGHKREVEEKNLVQPPALIVGTAGRLADHIRRGNITVDSIATIVMDEFDKSLEQGFEEEISFIISSLPAIKKRILTSATDAIDIPGFIGADVVRLEFLPGDEKDSSALTIQSVLSDSKDKLETLFKLVCSLGNRSTIIFRNHRESVERASEFLSQKGIITTFYHGALEQRDREMALAKFRNGSINILVTTDLASRGLDIPNIRNIIHYHLPPTERIFTHRNGRTARMDASGTAILVLSSDEKLPAYITTPVDKIEFSSTITLPDKPKWATLFVGAGKKDKVNKIDIEGIPSNKAQLKKEDIGLIEVKDFFSFVAIRKAAASHTLQLIKDQKIKNKKVKIDMAK